MKISIITACYNSAETILDTINSVKAQTYNNIEHIIVDGDSSDDTMLIVENSPSVTKYISEPDDGIYDAMNKGLKLATGDIVGTLNADDFYTDETVIEQIVNGFVEYDVDALYGDLVYVDQHHVEKTVRHWKSMPYSNGLFQKSWVPPHPTFFAKKDVYEQFGYFDLQYQLAADFELLFRFIEVNQVPTAYLPKILVKMRLGGATNKNFTNIIQQNREILSILRAYYPRFSALRWGYFKLVDRISQFICRV